MTRLTMRHVEPPSDGDCVAGVLESIRLGYAAQDVNCRPLADLVPVAAHGGLLAEGSLENPWTGMPAGTKLEDLTIGQWLNLGSPDGVHFPATIAQILDAVAGKDFTPCFDLKPGTGTHKVKPYTYIKAAAVLSGVPCLVMTEQWSKSASRTRAQKEDWLASAILRLAAAKQAGLPTMLLWRELLPVTHPVWGLVVAVKGAPKTQLLPPHVIPVPNSSSAADARTMLAKVTDTVDWTPEVPPVVTPLRVDAIDLSHFNPVTLDDLTAAKAGGVKAVWHKATEATEFVDAFYAVRRRMAGTAGLPIGGYHFARPGASSAAVQAAHFLKTATPKPGDLLPMLDLEDRGGLSQAALTKWVGAFVAAMPVKPIIYTPFDLDDTFGCLLWVARYSNANAAPNIPKPWKSAAIRQFSNGEFGVPKSAPGVGHVDLNQLNVPLADLLIPTPEVPPVDDRYDRITYGGKTLDKFTVQALQACEAALGYELTIVQGSYHKGVGASAGTHDGGGAVDLAPFDWANKVRVLRENGFAAWHRRPAQGPWKEHVHAILIGNDKASAGAKQQVAAYRNGRNGLANKGPDDGPRVLIHEFHYEEDDMPWTEKQLRTFMSEEAEKVVAKYVGDVVPAPTTADPKNTIWAATALGRLLASKEIKP